MLKLKWNSDATPVFNESALARLVPLLNKKYRAMLNNEELRIESGKAGGLVQVRTTLASIDGSKAYPVEGIVVLSEEHEGMLDEGGEDHEEALALVLLDYLDSYWNEYLTAGRDTYLPLDWSKHECEGHALYLRGFVRDLGAEALADQLLREHGPGAYDIEGISSET